MVILKDVTGLTIKRRIDEENHVRLGVTEIRLWVDGRSRQHRPMERPHGEYTIDECNDLLEELERLA